MASGYQFVMGEQFAVALSCLLSQNISHLPIEPYGEKVILIFNAANLMHHFL